MWHIGGGHEQQETIQMIHSLRFSLPARTLLTASLLLALSGCGAQSAEVGERFYARRATNGLNEAEVNRERAAEELRTITAQNRKLRERVLKLQQEAEQVRMERQTCSSAADRLRRETAEEGSAPPP
jgi:hypothetical protein